MMSVQMLILTLDGITAGDYLTWARDPEPPALGRELRAVAVRADPVGDRVEARLRWHSEPPAPPVAATLAGFALTPEVVGVAARTLRPRRTSAPGSAPDSPLPVVRAA